MSLAMTKEERETFLAGLHVGVISIEQEGEAPLTVPIWYDYAPDAGVWVITGDSSLKARHLLAAERFQELASQRSANPLTRTFSHWSKAECPENPCIPSMTASCGIASKDGGGSISLL